MYIFKLLSMLILTIFYTNGKSSAIRRVEFFYSNEKITWDQGSQWCANNGGAFASVHSDIEAEITQAIHPLLSNIVDESHVYLGAYWNSILSQWTWVDGTNFDYEFTSGLTGSSDDDVLIQKKDSARQWAVESKSTAHHVLCHRLPPMEYFTAWEGSYYFPARDKCNWLGGDLASIHSIQDYLKIKYLRHQADVGLVDSTGQLWLGLVSKRAFKGRWKWEDGTTLDWWPLAESLTTKDYDFNYWDSVNLENGDQLQGLYKHDEIDDKLNYYKQSTVQGYVSPSVACQRVTSDLPPSPKLDEININFDVSNNNFELTVNPVLNKASYIKVKMIKTFAETGITYGTMPANWKPISSTNYFYHQHSHLNAIQLCSKQCARISKIREMVGFYVKTEDHTTNADKGMCTCVTEYTTEGETSTVPGTGFFKQTYHDTIMNSDTQIFGSLNLDTLITPIQIFACNEKGCSIATELKIHCEIPRTTDAGVTAKVVITHDCLSLSHASDGGDPYHLYAKTTVSGDLHVTGVKYLGKSIRSILGYGNTGMIFDVKTGGSLYLKNIKLKNGNKFGPHQYGGAIKANSATIHATNVVFHENYAYVGSAVWATASQLFFENVDFTNNVIKAFSGGEAEGGGIIRVESSSTLEYNGGIIANNVANNGVNSKKGAGISCYKSTCKLKNLSVRNNIGMLGSAIYQKIGTLKIENSIVENNGDDTLTENGGAIFLSGKDDDNTFPGFDTFINQGTIVKGNKARNDTGNGGAIYTYANGNLLLNNVAIKDNTANTADYIFTDKDNDKEPTLNFLNVTFGVSATPFGGSCSGSICNVKNCAAIGLTHCHADYGFPNSTCSNQAIADHGISCHALPVPSFLSITIENNDEISLQIAGPDGGAMLADSYKVDIIEPVNGVTTSFSYDNPGKFSISTPTVYNNKHIKMDKTILIYTIEVTACTTDDKCGRKLVITTNCYPPRSCTECKRTCTIHGHDKEIGRSFDAYTRI